MMLTRAGRATRAVERNVNLVDGVESQGEFGSEKTRHTRTRRGTHDESDSMVTGSVVKRNQGVHVIGIVGDRHDVESSIDERRGESRLRSRSAQNDRVAGRIGEGVDRLAERTTIEIAERIESRGIDIVDDDRTAGFDQLASDPGSDRPEADHTDRAG